MRSANRKPVPEFEGVGLVRGAGYEGPVRYRITGDPAQLRSGQNRLRAGLTTTASLADQAFRTGEGYLTIEGGLQFRLTMLGHTAGGTEVFVELRV